VLGEERRFGPRHIDGKEHPERERGKKEEGQKK
jgi:hypothetical protein